MFATFLLAALLTANTISVTDGDTIRIGDERIRVMGLDAPELRGKCREERRLAVRAKDALSRELSSGSIDIQRHGLDKYRRTLARVYVNGRDVAEVLINMGLARPYEGGKRAGWC